MENQSLEVECPKRVINIFGQINPEMTYEILNQIYDIEYFDSQIKATNEDAELYPVVVNIMSQGGCCYSCQAILDGLLSLEAPVITRGYGEIQSAAFVLFLTGDIRLSGKHTTFMTHSLTYNIGEGKLNVQKQEFDEFTRMNNRILDFISDKTDIPREYLAENIDKEIYMDYNEAIQYHVVTDDVSLNAIYDLYYDEENA